MINRATYMQRMSRQISSFAPSISRPAFSGPSNPVRLGSSVARQSCIFKATITHARHRNIDDEITGRRNWDEGIGLMLGDMLQSQDVSHVTCVMTSQSLVISSARCSSTISPSSVLSYYYPAIKLIPSWSKFPPGYNKHCRN